MTKWWCGKWIWIGGFVGWLTQDVSWPWLMLLACLVISETYL